MQPNPPIVIGYTALPPAGRGPGVLLCHPWWGLNDDIRARCDSLAAAGYVVIAPDLWGGVVASTIDEAESLITARDGAAMLAAVNAALATLATHPAVTPGPLGAIGFSMGAAWALHLSTVSQQIGAVAIFYGTDVADFAASHAAYQGHFAPGDPWEPDDAVRDLEQSMRDVGRDAQFFWYEATQHWFMEPSRPEHDVAAATLAWDRTLAFLAGQLMKHGA